MSKSTEGLFLYGICEGYSSSEYKKKDGSTGYNHRVGISREYVDQYNNTQKNTVDVNLTQNADNFKALVDTAVSLKGKPVFIGVGVSARVGGRDGAWLSYFTLRDSVIASQVAK